MEDFGKLPEHEYSRMFEVFEKRKKKNQDHFESTKNILTVAFDKILTILEQTEDSFDFSMSLKHEIKQKLVYNSNTQAVTKWSYPKRQSQINWENYLVGIKNSGYSEFNFIFKDGSTSDAVMSAQSPTVCKLIE